jgi:hypothetical protein
MLSQRDHIVLATYSIRPSAVTQLVLHASKVRAARQRARRQGFRRHTLRVPMARSTTGMFSSVAVMVRRALVVMCSRVQLTYKSRRPLPRAIPVSCRQYKPHLNCIRSWLAFDLRDM